MKYLSFEQHKIIKMSSFNQIVIINYIPTYIQIEISHKKYSRESSRERRNKARNNLSTKLKLN